MKDFLPFQFNALQCQQEVEELEALLNSHSELREQETLLPFFRTHHQATALMGTFFTYVGAPDRLAFEYDLFGDFTCDIVVGDSTSQQYGFIELKDATKSSLFVNRKGRTAAYWSTRFEQGYSQVADWFWKLQDMLPTQAFTHRFGSGYIKYEGMLIIGRDQFLNQQDRQRLLWRQDKMLVDARRIHVLTYDELLRLLKMKLTLYYS